MKKGIRDRLLAFLRAEKVLTLAGIDAAGPHAAAVFYAVDDKLRLYVVSDPSTRHGQIMASGQEIAGTVQGVHHSWHDVQGVQFRGTAQQLHGAAAKRGWAIYTGRFPMVMEGSMVITSALAKTALWQITPTWMRLIDNRLGFGHKEEWRRLGPRRRGD